jgi:hypothetical protein
MALPSTFVRKLGAVQPPQVAPEMAEPEPPMAGAPITTPPVQRYQGALDRISSLTQLAAGELSKQPASQNLDQLMHTIGIIDENVADLQNRLNNIAKNTFYVDDGLTLERDITQCQAQAQYLVQALQAAGIGMQLHGLGAADGESSSGWKLAGIVVGTLILAGAGYWLYTHRKSLGATT